MAASTIDLQAIVEQVLPAATVRGQAGFRPKERDGILASLKTRRIPDYYRNTPGDCGGGNTVGTGSLMAASYGAKATGFLTQPLSAGATPLLGASAAVPIIGGIIAAGLTIFGAVTAHHKKAVALEQGTLCQVIPSANAVLADIDQRFAADQISLEQAFGELDGLREGFANAVRAILQMSPTQCNAACCYLRDLDAQILLRKQLYQGQPSKLSGFAGLLAEIGLPAAGAAAVHVLL